MVINPESEGKPTRYEDVPSWTDEDVVECHEQMGRRNTLLWTNMLDMGGVRRRYAAGRIDGAYPAECRLCRRFGDDHAEIEQQVNIGEDDIT